MKPQPFRKLFISVIDKNGWCGHPGTGHTAEVLRRPGTANQLVLGEPARHHAGQARPNVALQQQAIGQPPGFGALLKGNSPAMQRLFDRMSRATRITINVSITGEAGTGKGLVAESIHRNSERRQGPFVAVDMAALPGGLVESELFGHEKGAFAGATSHRTGKFEQANGGTLFLDNIGDLSPAIQGKLLRVLQEREMQRVGSRDKIKLDVRLVTATHKDLAEEVRKGTFREGLYFRLLGLPIGLPPLRERRADIGVLARHFLAAFCQPPQSPLLLSAAAQAKLAAHDYPGNVRELQAVLARAAKRSNGREICPADLLFAPPA